MTFVQSFLLPASVKDLIEAAGVPHPEVELILANGAPVDFSYLVHDADRIAVYPAFHSLEVSSFPSLRTRPGRIAFVLDTHLGVLAGYLRMLGFDAIYHNDSSDQELARISSMEDRILLTRDRGLLKRREVVYGYFARATMPRRQLQEVVHRYALLPWSKPFTRCIHCNGRLRSIGKEAVLHRLEVRTASSFDKFTICDECGKIYWEGSHFRRMERFIAEALRAA